MFVTIYNFDVFHASICYSELNLVWNKQKRIINGQRADSGSPGSGHYSYMYVIYMLYILRASIVKCFKCMFV